MKYYAFKEKQQKEFDSFPMGAAFSSNQLKEEMVRLGVNNSDELIGIGGGCFIRKSDKADFNKLINKLHDEVQIFLDDDDNLFDALVYELANHEYCITYDADDAIYALDYDKMDERFFSILEKAKRYYLSNCDNL